jgi:hypothetical protein
MNKTEKYKGDFLYQIRKMQTEEYNRIVELINKYNQSQGDICIYDKDEFLKELETLIKKF